MTLLARAAVRSLRARPLQALGLAGLVAAMVVMVVGGLGARALLAEGPEQWADELHVADLEVRFSPTHLDPAPNVAAVKGVASVGSRLVGHGRLAVDGNDSEQDEVPALVASLPEPAVANRLHVLAGRLPKPGEAAAVLDRSVAAFHGLEVGSRVRLTLGPEELDVPVVGVALSAEHLVFPVHPEYALPIRGSVAVVFLSRAALEPLEHGSAVTSLLVTLEDDAPPDSEARILEAMHAAVEGVIPRAERPDARMRRLVVSGYDAFLLPAGVIFTLVTLALLLLVLRHEARRERATTGALLAGGASAWSIALAALPRTLIPVAVGLAVGGGLQRIVAHGIHATYQQTMGFPPARNGDGSLLLFVALLTIAVAAATSIAYTLWLATKSPASLLRPESPRIRGRFATALARVAATLRDVLRVPPSLSLGVQHGMRRFGETLGSALGLGTALALMLAILVVHKTHEAELDDFVTRMSLDAAVRFHEPGDSETVADLGRVAEGDAEPFLSRIGMLTGGSDALFVRTVGAPLSGAWMRRQRVAQGRHPRQAGEALIDHRIADQSGIGLGDEVLAYPGPNAPEGLALQVVGIVDGLSSGLLVVPLADAQSLFSLPGLATGAQVTSDLASERMEARLRESSAAEAVFVREVASRGVRANFDGMTAVLGLAVLLSAAVVVAFLTVLAAFDADERAPELAALEALGWSAGQILASCLGTVYLRGLLTMGVAWLATPWLVDGLLERIAAGSAVHLRALDPTPTVFAACVLLALLLPLSVYPTWRTARSQSPAATLRRLHVS